MQKPIIGITTNLLHRASSIDGKFATNANAEYDLSVVQAGGTPILLPVTTDIACIEAQLAICEGLILAGGDDLNPLSYGEEPYKALGETNLTTDTHHLQLTRLALREKKPILAICRGMQVLNVACGGNVYQDLSQMPRETFKHSQLAPRGQCCHTVTTEDESTLSKLLGPSFPVNSFHHQALHKLGDRISASAWAKDRTIEGIELKDYPFGVGVQWHPEIMLQYDDAMMPLFKAFIEACIKK